MAHPHKIVVLTGAGISAESGIATFRDSDGLWENHRIEDVASPAGFAANPELVQRFYDARRAQAKMAHPNAAHYALAKLETALRNAGHPALVIITQNIDDLHERAGSTAVLHMHGELNSALCAECGHRFRFLGALSDDPACPACARMALRPDVVWFGEGIYHGAEIEEALDNADWFIVIGTSGVVYPAAGFAVWARAAGARTVLLNLTESDGVAQFDEVRLGPATAVVPAWVAEMMDELELVTDSDAP